MKFGSLFSGIGGFDLGFERAGMECAWQREIDKKCQEVLLKKFGVKIYDDVRSITAGNTEPVDLICGGFPCQDVSIAGKRAGLAGERSGLFYEFIRIVSELRPMWVVVENVPGLLSSNNGKDIQIVIDSFTHIGYTVDIDIKDAQEFGVAQRRRRVFLTCVKLDGLLQKRTNLSRQISADLLAQILLNAWGATRQASSLVPLHLVFEKPIERSVNFLRKMTSLLRITREILACKKYQNDLDVLLDQFGGEGKNSEYGSIRKSGIQKGENSGETDMFPFEPKAENGDTNISLWLSEYLDAVCETESQFTTSILRNRITDHQIYTFVVMALTIAERILLSIDWSESCWSVASSFSILLQESTNYARQASRNLFIEPGLRDGWRDYLGTASRIQGEFERHLGAIHERQVLFEREGVRWNPPARGKTGQGTTRETCSSIEGRCYKGINSDNLDHMVSVGALQARDYKGVGNQYVDEGKVIAYENHPADSRITETGDISQQLTSRMGTGGGNVPLVAHSLTFCDSNGTRQDRPNGGLYVKEVDKSNTLAGSGDGGVLVSGYRMTAFGEYADDNSASSLKTRDYKDATDIVATSRTLRQGKEGGGKGYLESEELGMTLGGQQQNVTIANWQSGGGKMDDDKAASLRSGAEVNYQFANTITGVRRLTPTECERLQGFPDGWTAGQSDSTRYKQLGNAVAVPVAEWIGKRIMECRN